MNHVPKISQAINAIRSKNLLRRAEDAEMSISDHLEELRYRLFIVLIIFAVAAMLSSFLLKDLTIILQKPAVGVKFLQLGPGEYFFVSIKMAIYSGIIFCCPFAVYQLLLFILPGLTAQETQVILPILIGSIALFFTGIVFGYQILAPATLNFFISYGNKVVEPLWSFEQYFNFILLLLLGTGLAFQIPILQIFFGLLGIISSDKMLSSWRYMILISTIAGAIFTPSTDPVTQTIMSSTIFTLYLIGIGILKSIRK